MLQHVGGHAMRLVERGGQEIQSESTRWLARHGTLNRHGHRILPVAGGVCPTSAGRLPYRYVLHTVPPSWNGDGGSSADVKALVATVQLVMDTAASLDLTTLFMPELVPGKPTSEPRRP